MVSEGRGRFYRRVDGKYLLYLPVYFCEDSMFPWKLNEKDRSTPVKVSFRLHSQSLRVERWTEKDKEGHNHNRKWQEDDDVLSKGRLFRRADGKYLIYVAVYFAEDSMFPFQDFGKGRRGKTDSIDVKVSFAPGAGQKLLIEKWVEPQSQETIHLADEGGG